MVKLAHFIPVVPFLAFVLNIFWGRKLKEASAIVSVLASSISFILAMLVWQGFGHHQGSYSLGTWLTVAGVPLNFGVTIDGLSVMMVLVVSFVGTLIQIYSIGYMHGDARFSRFFAYMSLFMSAMLGLVLADNFVLLYIFWEGVGLGSYLLISFWFERPAAAAAGLKAFITTRIGDVGLLIGIFILFLTAHTFSFADLAGITGHDGVLTVVALLVFWGAVGKSAQFPLHVWLPDAMEGPTPVSALIHAATMVAAGVYLVARTYVLFSAHPVCLQVVAVIGGISALMAASIATVQNDIKRILAYSTMSQLGLMMLGLGVGGFGAGTFHLMTHAFFKALLFLCAGSVIHAVHTQDIQKMGGLYGKMKVTGFTFVIGTLALAGIPPFAGFWSKDEILAAALNSGHWVLFGVASLASLLTAFYMSRLIFLVLFGKPRSEIEAHESPAVMTVPLLVLAVFSAGIGFIGSPLGEHAVANYLMMGVSTLIGVTGIGIAYIIYMRGNKILPAAVREKFTPLYTLLWNKYYIDEIYDAVLVRPCLAVCNWCARFDTSVIDGIVTGLTNGIRRLGEVLQALQSGFVQHYLFAVAAGLAVILILLR